MCNKNFGYTVKLLVVLFAVSVYSNPIIIRTGIAKNHGQHQDTNVYDAAHQRGIANLEEDAGFNKDNAKKFVSSSDAGRYGEEGGNVKDHLDQNNFDKESFYQNGGGDIADFGNKKAHKKGHHKSGFHNSYHKDEQGSNSSFYDDGDDQGDEYVYKTHKGSFGDAGQDRRRSGNLDSAHFANAGTRQNQFDNGGKFEKDIGSRQNYDRNRYYDDRENGGRRNAANGYGEAGRYQEEKYIQKPHYKPYYEPHYNHPVHHKKQITIYEDPRYEGRLPHQERYGPSYADDYIELDVRPLGREDYRHYDRRPPYDYYY